MSPNRVVAALTPLAAVLAGLSADWLAKHAPGLDIPASSFEEIFIAGIGAVVAPAVVWLLGWQRHEAREAEATDRAIALAAAEPDLGSDPAELDFDDLGPELEEEDSIAVEGFDELDDDLSGLDDDEFDELDDDEFDELDEEDTDEFVDSPLAGKVG